MFFHAVLSPNTIPQTKRRRQSHWCLFLESFVKAICCDCSEMTSLEACPHLSEALLPGWPCCSCCLLFALHLTAITLLQLQVPALGGCARCAAGYTCGSRLQSRGFASAVCRSPQPQSCSHSGSTAAPLGPGPASCEGLCPPQPRAGGVTATPICDGSGCFSLM